MTTFVDQVAAVIAEHTWWLHGNLGVPGMPDYTTYKCNCGWSGAEPHAHVAKAVTDLTAPLPVRLRNSAETVELMNAMSGLGLNCSASPGWLRKEADRMDQEAVI